jgi:hypothetical protein
MQTAWQRLLEGLDASKLKEGLSLEDAVETIGLLADGLEKQLLALMKSGTLSLPAIAARTWRHLSRLRDGLYRQA